jgi:hypothetical protein
MARAISLQIIPINCQDMLDLFHAFVIGKKAITSIYSKVNDIKEYYPMTEKYEFMSKEWLAKLEAIMRELVEQSKEQVSDISFSLNQIFTEVPETVVQDPLGRAGWWIRLTYGEFEFGTGEIPEATIKLIAPYDIMLPLARLVWAEDPEAMDQTISTIGQGVSDGSISYHDDGKGLPEPLVPAHDLIAEFTA